MVLTEEFDVELTDQLVSLGVPVLPIEGTVVVAVCPSKPPSIVGNSPITCCAKPKFINKESAKTL